MENGSLEYSKVCYLFSFSSYFKALDDYVILHNLSMPLTYIVTLYHNDIQ